MSKTQTELLARITRLEKLVAARPAQPPPSERDKRERERRIGKQEVADRLGMHTATVDRRKNKDPNFPLPKLIAGKWTWTVGQIDDYIAKQPEAVVIETEAA
jgi:predicted DNA-binding transcriptional regulator AlpA